MRFPIRRILRSFLRSMEMHIVARGQKSKLIQTKGGLRMYLSPGNEMDEGFYFDDYDPALQALIRKYVGVGDTVLDVGSQKGFWALKLAQIVGNSGRVLAFEPDPNAREFLLKHIDVNHAHSVHVNGCALSDSAGELDFFISEYLGWSSSYPNTKAQTTRLTKATVERTSLDAFCLENNIESTEIRFIKLDCEGAEAKIVAGGLQTFRQTSAPVHIEINRGSLEKAGDDPSSLCRSLQELGFCLYLPLADKRHKLTLTRLPNELPDRSLFNVIALKGPLR